MAERPALEAVQDRFDTDIPYQKRNYYGLFS